MVTGVTPFQAARRTRAGSSVLSGGARWDGTLPWHPRARAGARSTCVEHEGGPGQCFCTRRRPGHGAAGCRMTGGAA